MDVGEGSGMTEHLNVESANEVLADLFICEIFFGEVLFDPCELVDDDTVFFLFGLSLAYTFDEGFEIFGEVIGGRHGRIINSNYLIK